jgi:hypothetical protein
MTPDEIYDKGYSDGYHDVAANASLVDNENYKMGYADGEGDRTAGAKPKGVKSAFIDAEFYENNNPPEGYHWTYEFRTPQKGEIYLTKNGNAGVAKSDPKNGRQRQMLQADRECHYCKFTAGHKGKCSYDLVTE